MPQATSRHRPWIHNSETVAERKEIHQQQPLAALHRHGGVEKKKSSQWKCIVARPRDGLKDVSQWNVHIWLYGHVHIVYAHAPRV